MDQAEFKVSVIIPVYNAAKYVRKAVEAAVMQEEVAEIILVEDCSPDNSLSVCKDLEQEFEKVKLYQHPDKKNHGCGASRNYGVGLAQHEFIVFADADNYLLPNRFLKDRELFLKYPDIDGVYNAEGVHYYSESSKDNFRNTVNMELLTFSQKVKPEEVFDVFMAAHPSAKGSWGIDGLTIRKSIFSKSGLFNTQLKLQQDVDLFIKLSLVGKFMAGNIEQPVCIRGVHDEQRSTDIQQQNIYRLQRWKSLKKWIDNNTLIGENQKRLFLKQYSSYRIHQSKGILPCYFWLKYVVQHPYEINKMYGFFDMNFFEAFGHNWFTLHLISFKNKFVKCEY